VWLEFHNRLSVIGNTANTKLSVTASYSKADHGVRVTAPRGVRNAAMNPAHVHVFLSEREFWNLLSATIGYRYDPRHV
jgi:hypothetical protein